MAHMIDMSNNRANIAYLGSTPWHGLGEQMKPGQSIDQWRAAAGLDWEAIRVPAFCRMPSGAFQEVTGAFFNARSDTGAVLGRATHSDQREEVQPRDVLAFFDRFISVDDRFHLDVAGAIKGGSTIWATATFRDDFQVAGERHQAYLLARTSFDGSSGTIVQCTTVRAVCNNTITAAYGDKRALISVRHTATFDPAVVAKQLAGMAQSVTTFKAIGDALAANAMAETEVVELFRKLLDIPADATSKDISTRKLNCFNELAQAYDTSVKEGAERGTAWAALQAVTRYVDHERTVRGDASVNDAEKRFTAAQFGSGEAMKGEVWQMLMPRIRDRVLIPA